MDWLCLLLKFDASCMFWPKLFVLKAFGFFAFESFIAI